MGVRKGPWGTTVFLPKGRTYRFPLVCVNCLEPAETEVKFKYRPPSYWIKLLWILVSFPILILVAAFANAIVGLIVAVSFWILAKITPVRVYSIEVPYCRKCSLWKKGFKFRVIGDYAEFTFGNPQYAERFIEANSDLLTGGS